MKHQQKKRRTAMNTKWMNDIPLTLRKMSSTYINTVLNLLGTIELQALQITQLKEELSIRDLMEKPIPRGPHGRK